MAYDVWIRTHEEGPYAHAGVASSIREAKSVARTYLGVSRLPRLRVSYVDGLVATGLAIHEGGRVRIEEQP